IFFLLISPPQVSHLRRLLEPLVFHDLENSGAERIAIWPWLVFLGGAMGCLACSSISHLLACHSHQFNLLFWRLDYAGISLMIVSSFFAPIYYVFFCNPPVRLLYMTSISLLGVLAIITLLAPSLSAPRFRPLRASIFLAMGFSGVIPAVHALVTHWQHPPILVALGYEVAMAVLYATGAVFYVTRVPERWKPGAFDIAGHSHQIFHIFVVLGALAHSVATLWIMNFRRGSPTCAF
ncbi:Casein kinase I hhp2, partial [Stylosanthes scabra]|nr:Casein kinase I hhp2 [Stylosanthes scabra]